MDGANRLRVRHGACAVPSIGLLDWGHVQGVSPAVWRDERSEPGAARSPQARRHNEGKGLRQKGSSTLMPRSLVLGMNDHQGSYWVLIVVTSTHRPLPATLRQSLSQSTRRKAAVHEILSASVVPQIHDISPYRVKSNLILCLRGAFL